MRKILDDCNLDKPLYMIGYGNTLRKDDGVGVYLVINLLKKISKKPEYIHIYQAPLNIEYVLKKISKESYIIICDAVKMNAEPGTVVFVEFKDLRHVFFDTHNVPLSIILEKRSLISNSYLLGIVPQSIEIGEDLTPIVKNSADKVVEVLAKLLEEKIEDRAS
ncbi:MAG: hydrogenase maturation protease [Nitrososphaerota archaeon]|nr:hydrogenase maturation protease [Nitrososphaerota archaeon]